jgi:hypothetical protein
MQARLQSAQPKTTGCLLEAAPVKGAHDYFGLWAWQAVFDTGRFYVHSPVLAFWLHWGEQNQ